MNGYMRIILACAFAIMAAIAPSRSWADDANAYDPSAIASFTNAYLEDAMRREHIPGAVVTIVADGTIIMAKGYGYSDVERMTPVDPDATLFSIGSVSKLFIADAVMRLAEGGAFGLDDDIAPFLSSFSLRNPYGTPVTFARLLTHTAGIDDQRVGDLSRDTGRKPLREFLSRHMMPVVRLPGSAIQYSSYGSALAACLVEEASGMRFDEYAERTIFSALGMGSTKYALNDERLSRGYFYRNGRYEAASLDGELNIYPVGAAISTASDMARYMIAHLSTEKPGNGSLFSAATATIEHDRHAGFDPLLPGMAYGFAERFIGGVRAIGHSGYSGHNNVSSDLCLVPERGLGVFIVVTQGMNDVPREFSSAFIERFAPLLSDIPEAPSVAASAKTLKSLHGIYRFGEYSRSTLDKISVFPFGEDISIEAAPQSRLRFSGNDAYSGKDASCDLDPIDGLRFRKSDGSGFVVFKIGADGSATMAETGSSGHGTFERLAWYETPTFQIAVFAFWFVVFLAVIVLAIVKSVMRLTTRLVKRRRLDLGAISLSSWLIIGISAVDIGFVIGIMFAFGSCIYGVSALGKALLTLPFVSMALSATLLATLFLALKTKKAVPHAPWVSAVFIAELAFLWFWNYWNWIGFKY